MYVIIVNLYIIIINLYITIVNLYIIIIYLFLIIINFTYVENTTYIFSRINKTPLCFYETNHAISFLKIV